MRGRIKRGEGGGRRGGGRRERGGKKGGREGKRGKFCAREACAAPEGRRETRGREGEVRGREGGEAYPPFHPLLYSVLYISSCSATEKITEN